MKSKFIGLFKIWSFVLLLCCIAVYTRIVNYNYFIKIDFLFTFIGVLIGFGLTFFTHVVGLIDKLKERFKEDKSGKISTLMNIYSEMKDDIYFLFYSLVLITATKLFSALFIIVKYSECCYIDNFTYTMIKDFKDSFLLSIFILCLLSIKDLIAIAFRLSEYTINPQNEAK